MAIERPMLEFLRLIMLLIPFYKMGQGSAPDSVDVLAVATSVKKYSLRRRESLPGPNGILKRLLESTFLYSGNKTYLNLTMPLRKRGKKA